LRLFVDRPVRPPNRQRNDRNTSQQRRHAADCPPHSTALCQFLFTCVHVPFLPLSFGSCHCDIVLHSFTPIARLSDRLTINGLPPSISDANGVAGGIVEVVGDRVVGVGLVEAIAGDVISFV
jgi:hypothetical protein